jgi:hypothetical protein
MKITLFVIVFLSIFSSTSAQNIPNELRDFVPQSRAALDDLAQKVAIFDLPTGFRNSVLPKYYGLDEKKVLSTQRKSGIIQFSDAGNGAQSQSVLISSFDAQQNLTKCIKAKELLSENKTIDPIANYFDGKYAYSFSKDQGWIATYKNIAVHMSTPGALSPAYYSKNAMDLEYFKFDNSKNAFVKEELPLVTLNEKNQVATVKMKSNGATILRTIIYDNKGIAYRIHEMQLDNQFQQYKDLIFDDKGLLLREQTSGGFVFEEFKYLNQ